MQKVRVLFFCLTILASLAASAPLLASGGYDKLYWIGIKGNCMHNTPDQGVVITSFMRYRQYSQDGDGVKPGYFQCIRNGMDMQISVREIKQIRLKQSPDSF